MALRFPGPLVALDDAIRSGQAALVRERLPSLVAGAPRPWLAPLANLAWRSGVPLLGLRVLAPHAKDPLGNAADVEFAEYAMCLLRVGAAEEALGRLRRLTRNADAPVQARFYEIAGLAERWEHGLATRELEAYVRRSDLTEYELLVGLVNLAGGYVFLRRQQPASALLRSLLRDTRFRGYRLLQAAVLEFAATQLFWSGEFGEAQRLADHAAELQTRGPELDALFVEKWRAAIALFRRPSHPGARERLLRIRARAEELRHSNTARECDRLVALGCRDEGLLNRVYFGTGSPGYREALARDARGWAVIPPRYVEGDTDLGRFDLALGTFRSTSGRTERLPLGLSLHRLLVILASERYTPATAGTIFAKLFPSEFFDPSVSTDRVHQAVRLARRWLLAHQIPMEIRVVDDAYRLESSGALEMVRSLAGAHDRVTVASHALGIEFGASPFTRSQAKQVLDLGTSAAGELLAELVDGQLLATEKRGRETFYRVVAPSGPAENAVQSR